ncbi:MAG: hypothetical protein ACO2PL_10700 [Armatimonadota bacterium]
MFNARVFRQCKSTALQKIAVSPFANRYSLLTIRRLLFATRHSLFAVVLALQDLALPLRSVPRPASHAPFRFCPMSLVQCPLSP